MVAQILTKRCRRLLRDIRDDDLDLLITFQHFEDDREEKVMIQCVDNEFMVSRMCEEDKDQFIVERYHTLVNIVNQLLSGVYNIAFYYAYTEDEDKEYFRFDGQVCYKHFQ